MAVSHVAAERDYPQMIAETDHAEPAPRWQPSSGDANQEWELIPVA
jgi:hypothetical protein